MDETDETLMFAVKEGKLPTLGVLFERHHAALYDFFCWMTGSQVASEDLVQEVFTRILKYRETYTGQGRFQTWMYRIARNAHADQRRSQPEGGFVSADEIPASLVTSDDEREREIELLDRALRTLAEDRRELLILSRYRRLPQEEIAKLLGLRVGAVKVRIHRAVNELREIYFELSNEKSPWNAKKHATTLRTF